MIKINKNKWKLTHCYVGPSAVLVLGKQLWVSRKSKPFAPYLNFLFLLSIPTLFIQNIGKLLEML
jgi:hypothetical protein